MTKSALHRGPADCNGTLYSTELDIRCKECGRVYVEPAITIRGLKRSFVDASALYPSAGIPGAYLDDTIIEILELRAKEAETPKKELPKILPPNDLPPSSSLP